jgi:signal transduction histidine kinase
VIVTVADSGHGIAPTKLHTIFQPFEQGTGNISRKYGGFGLGLNIAQVSFLFFTLLM